MPGCWGLREREHVLNDRREQVLILDYPDDSEEHHQQSGKRKSFLEGVADLMLFDDAVERGLDDDDREPYDPDGGNVKSERKHEKDGGDPLNDEAGGVTSRADFGLVVVEIDEDFTDTLGKERAVEERSSLFENQAGQKAHPQNRHRHRRHAVDEFHELPSRIARDQEVLWFADRRAHAAEGRADGGVHEEGSQKRPKLIEILAEEVTDGLVLAVLVVVLVALA